MNKNKKILIVLIIALAVILIQKLDFDLVARNELGQVEGVSAAAVTAALEDYLLLAITIDVCYIADQGAVGKGQLAGDIHKNSCPIAACLITSTF